MPVAWKNGGNIGATIKTSTAGQYRCVIFSNQPYEQHVNVLTTLCVMLIFFSLGSTFWASGKSGRDESMISNLHKFQAGKQIQTASCKDVSLPPESPIRFGHLAPSLFLWTAASSFLGPTHVAQVGTANPLYTLSSLAPGVDTWPTIWTDSLSSEGFSREGLTLWW